MSNRRYRDREKINRMLDLLSITVSKKSSFRPFIDSITEQWEREEWLSARQLRAIEKAYSLDKDTIDGNDTD